MSTGTVRPPCYVGQMDRTNFRLIQAIAYIPEHDEHCLDVVVVVLCRAMLVQGILSSHEAFDGHTNII